MIGRYMGAAVWSLVCNRKQRTNKSDYFQWCNCGTAILHCLVFVISKPDHSTGVHFFKLKNSVISIAIRNLKAALRI